MRAPEIASAAKAETRVEFDFTDFCDDSGSQTHVVELPTADEVEAEIFDETVGTAQLFKIFSNNRSIHAR